jgi:hypothetical protein
VLALCASFVLTACEDEDKVVEKATKVAIEHAKEVDEKEFVPNGDVEFTTATGGGTVWIRGYYKDKPSERVSVTINYDYEADKYWGSGIGYGVFEGETTPEEYIKE